MCIQVFTTCSSQKKRDFLQQTFPFLDINHIGDSRSTSFEVLIRRQVSLGFFQSPLSEPMSQRNRGLHL